MTDNIAHEEVVSANTDEYLKLFDKIGDDIESLAVLASEIKSANCDQARVASVCKYVSDAQKYQEEIYKLLVCMHNVFSEKIHAE